MKNEIDHETKIENISIHYTNNSLYKISDDHRYSIRNNLKTISIDPYLYSGGIYKIVTLFDSYSIYYDNSKYTYYKLMVRRFYKRTLSDGYYVLSRNTLFNLSENYHEYIGGKRRRRNMFYVYTE